MTSYRSRNLPPLFKCFIWFRQHFLIVRFRTFINTGYFLPIWRINRIYNSFRCCRRPIASTNTWTIIFTFYISVVLFYLFLSIISSLQLSIKNKNISLFFLMPFTFFIFHVTHGIGVIIGLIKLIFGIAPISKISN